MKINSNYQTYRARVVRRFVEAILHGSEEHRAWLVAAGEQFIWDGTVPPEEKEDE